MSTFMRILILFIAMGAGMLYKRISETLCDLPAPKLPLDQWWGDGERPKDWQEYLKKTDEIISNKLIYRNDTITALHKQLGQKLRLTEPIEGTNFDNGFNTKYLKEIVDYWRDDYMPRWRGREVFLWQFNHFTTEIQGLRMHFLHLMAYEEAKVGKHFYPVLLLHSWPGSIREFYALIRKLHQINEKENKYLFNVVVPSLPGFGWSQGTSKPGMGPAEIAVVMHNLMDRLGYKKYFIQGGDWGSLVGSHMATLFSDSVLGYHSNLCTVLTPKSSLKGIVASYFPSYFAPKEYAEFFFPMSKKLAYLLEEIGYYHLQSTKPDTIGIALTDNPVGLASYILEKFSTWTNPKYRNSSNGGLKKRFQLDALLDNVMIYHLTNSITTSVRIYAEHLSKKQRDLQLYRIQTIVPTGCARFKHDLMHFLDFQLKDKYPNLIHSTYHKEGGHFAALELPTVLYNDFIEFVKKVEQFSKIKGL